MSASSKNHTAIDVVKLIMAFLVVAIHTEPFGFSFWLDKGFGIITRLCVPFFFVASSYFFFSGNGNPVKYVKRLGLLYVVWSLIYLPFDLSVLKAMTAGQILVKYLWTGNGHALWYLCGSIIGFGIVWGLSKVLKPKQVFAVAVVFWIFGCLKSTYAPVVQRLLSVTLPDSLGSRNGLFYAFVYYALGLMIAEKNETHAGPQLKNLIGFAVSMLLLVAESLVLVYLFKTEQTILWFSVLPLTYHFFMIVKSMQFPITQTQSLFCRKLSTLIYVSHCFYMYLFPGLRFWASFLAVAAIATAASIIIYYLSRQKAFRWMKILY